MFIHILFDYEPSLTLNYTANQMENVPAIIIITIMILSIILSRPRTMETTIQNVRKLLREQIAELKEHGQHYLAEYGDVYSEEMTVADFIHNLDIDSTEFNAGFEQGYMRALQEIIRMEK